MNLLENINYGLIIVERESLKVEYLNAAALGWFGNIRDKRLDHVLPELLVEKMHRRQRAANHSLKTAHSRTLTQFVNDLLS